MARVKRAVNAQKKRRSILESAKGYRGQRSRLYRKAKEQMLHSMNYAYRDRRARKGDFRKLWITRINAATRQHGLTYVWRPIPSGRHAFAADALDAEPREQVTSYCGVHADAAELHDRSEAEWVHRGTCMDCWRVLSESQVRPFR